jgi:hypothetical protein
VAIPADAADAITFGTGISKVGLSLPVTESASATELVEGNAVITGEDTSFVVDALPNGFRIASVLNNRDADHSLTYDLDLPPGVGPRLNADGSVSLVLDNSDDRLEASVATFAAPWAVDAAGRSVETRFEVADGTLTQVVTPSSTSVYPIVADPSVSGCLIWGWYPALCIKYNRAETERAWNSAVIGIGGAAFAAELCSGIPNLAWKGACKAAVAAITFAVINNVRTAHDQGRCLRIRITYPAIPAILGFSEVVNC